MDADAPRHARSANAHQARSCWERSQDHVPSLVDRGEARYCASKLLCLMYVRHLACVLPDIGVMAFNPSVVPGTEIGRDRNWLQQLAWKYVMPLLTPLLPGARSLNQSVSDLLWLLTEADGRRLSGHYVDGRLARSGSEDSRDQVKIARTVEVAYSTLAHALASTRSEAHKRPSQLSPVPG